MDWKLSLRRSHANLGILTAITLGLIAVSCFFIAHKPGGKGSTLEATGKVLKDIHFGKFLPKDLRWIWIDSQGLALFALVGSGWFLHIRERRKRAVEAADPSSPRSGVTVVYASQSGTAERLARALADEAEGKGLRAYVCNLADYPLERLAEERYLLAVVSTFGKGVAPEAAQDFETRLNEHSAKLGQLEYAVLALGDVRYPKFCAFGKMLDERLAALGATRLAARCDCGVDHAEVSLEWTRGILALLEARRAMPVPQPKAKKARPTTTAEAAPEGSSAPA
jgi:sulfite reductase alpha subunit-like flavoprotein